MSDLTATNCGCGGGCPSGGNNNCCSIIIWIILLSCLCGNGRGMNGIFGGGCDDDCGCGNNNCIWLILILIFCGGGCGF